MRWSIGSADAAAVRTWDGLVIFWVVLWAVVGVGVGWALFGLTGVADSTVESGRALQAAGRALSDLSNVPVIGDRTGQFGAQVTSTANGIVANATMARASVRGLAVLIGLVVGLAPSGPVVLIYLPSRIERRRELTALRRALGTGPLGGTLQSLLAHRAIANVAFARLQTVSEDPAADLAAGRHQDLALAELARLGLTPAGG